MTDHRARAARRAAVQAMRNRPQPSFDEGRYRGFSEGYAQGFERGFAAGAGSAWDAGFDAGFDDGAEDAGPEAFAEGWAEGWSAQPEDQRSAAFREGYESALKDLEQRKPC